MDGKSTTVLSSGVLCSKKGPSQLLEKIDCKVTTRSINLSMRGDQQRRGSGGNEDTGISLLCSVRRIVIGKWKQLEHGTDRGYEYELDIILAETSHMMIE